MLTIIGIILLVIGILGMIAGIILLVRDMMESIAGPVIIAGVGFLLAGIGGGLWGYNYYHTQQVKQFEKQQLILKKKKEVAAKELAKKKAAEAEKKKLMGTSGSSEVTMRQLTPQEYALTPQTIYRMYNTKGQNFFDEQYDSGDDKNYALKHIGITLPGLTFNTTSGNRAVVDNLAGDKKKIVLAVIKMEPDKSNPAVITNSEEVMNSLNLIQGMALNYPDVNFIILFPGITQKSWNGFMSALSDSVQQQLKSYKLIAIGGENPNVGSNYGSLDQFVDKTLNWNGQEVLVTIDKHDRIALTKYGSINNGNSSSNGQSLVTRIVNLSFTNNDGQKIYNLLKPEDEIKAIAKEGNQGLSNDIGGTNQTTNGVKRPNKQIASDD